MAVDRGFQQRAGGSLERQIARQINAGHQRLEIVGQQQALRAAARAVVMHDPALEALIDEVMVGRVVRRPAGRRTPYFEIEQTQDARVGRARGSRVDRVEEGAEEIDLLTVKSVLRVL